MQMALAVVVSVAWIAVVLVPMFVPSVKLEASVQIGVQAAMMAVLGAIFGIKLVRKNGDKP